MSRRSCFDIRRLLAPLLLCAAADMILASAVLAAKPARDKLVYLLPAPSTAIAFAPFALAQQQGYYKDEGLEVEFRTISGGLNVGRALASGEGDLGGALGDTLLMLRDEGMPIKGVALLGSHAFLTLMTNHGSHVVQGELAGKRFGVPSMTDISNYALQHWLNTSGVPAGAVSVVALPAEQLVEQLVDHRLDGIVLTVDWGVKAEAKGAVLDYTSTDRFYPAMAQIVMASEDRIAVHPESISRFVRATLRSVNAIRSNPEGMAIAYTRHVPQSGLSQAQVARAFVLYGRYVYGDVPVSGAFKDATFEALQEGYLGHGLVKQRRNPETFFDNAFVR